MLNSLSDLAPDPPKESFLPSETPSDAQPLRARLKEMASPPKIVARVGSLVMVVAFIEEVRVC